MEQLTKKRKVRKFLSVLLAAATLFTSGNSLQVFAETVSTDAIVEELTSGVEVTGLNGEGTISADEVSENSVSEDQVSANSVSDDNAPIHLTVSTNQYNSLKVSWVDQLFNVDKYAVYRRVSDLDGEWKCVKKVKATADSSYSNSGLKYDTAYQYRVDAWNSAGTVVGTSAVVGATTKIGAPNADKMKAVLSKKNVLTVTWAGVSGAKYYTIERRKADGTWEVLKGPEDNFRAKKYVDKVDFTNAENYLYRVTAGRAKDKYSSVLFGESEMVLCQPVLLELGTVDNKETMGVRFTQSKGATSYIVQRSLKNKSAYTALPTVAGASAVNSTKYFGNVVTSLNGQGVDSIFIKDNGKNANGGYLQLEHGAYYYYKVCAQVTVDGKTVTSKYSKDTKIRDTMDAPELAKIDLIDGSHINMVWEDQDIIRQTYNDYYEIWRSTKPLTGYKKLKTVKVADTTKVSANNIGVSYNCVSYTLKDVPAEVTYYYKVVSVHNKIRGTMSDYISARTLLDDLKDLIVESANYNAMSLIFPKVEGATQYNIYMAKNITDANGNAIPYNNMMFKKVAVCKAKPDELTGLISYTKTGLTHGSYYAFKVRPATKNGEHQPVGAELYKVAQTRIKAPKLTATSQAFSKKTIDVKWNAVSGASRYVLEESTNKDFINANIYDMAKSTKKTFSNLTVGTKYYYRVTAYKKDSKVEGGELAGTPSKAVCEWVRPGMPQNLESVGYAGGKGAKLTWSKITDTSTSSYSLQCFQIQRSMGVDTDKDGEYEDWTNIAQIEKSVYSYKDESDIANGKMVHYRVFGLYRRTDGTGEDLWGRFGNVDFCNPKSIKLNYSKITIEEGESATLKVSKYDPTYTTSKAIKWSTDDSDYVSITSKGVIKGVKITKKNKPIEITAMSTSGAYATCIVTVIERQIDDVGGGKVIVLDPGHGGVDGGCSSGGLVEKNLTLKISTYTKGYLEQAGFDVYMTRTGDSTIDSRKTRVEMYKDKKPSLLVSQHINSGSASGVECFYSVKGYGKDIAAKMASYTASAMGVPNRGAKTRESNDTPGTDYYGINLYAANLGFPGIIMENGFIQADSSKMDSDDDLRVIARANADAIIDYFR